MVSESVSWPVSMMIGALKPFLRSSARLAAVDVRQADIHDDEVDLAGLGGLDALGAGLDRHGLELVVQRELLGQGVRSSASSSTIRILRVFSIESALSAQGWPGGIGAK